MRLRRVVALAALLLLALGGVARAQGMDYAELAFLLEPWRSPHIVAFVWRQTGGTVLGLFGLWALRHWRGP